MIQGNISATQSLTGSARETGIQGLSAYEVYKKNGGTLSEEEWLVSLKGEKGDKGEQGIQGERGAAFTYTDFTEEQLEGLVGPKGEKGEQGPAGPQGEHGAKGEKGDTGETGPQGPQGEQGPKGEKGEAFTYDMFTEEQLASLTGPQGPQGVKGEKGERGSDGLSLEEITEITGELKNLGTEDKSNLVNAINELVNNGGVKEIKTSTVDLQTLDAGAYIVNGGLKIIYYNGSSISITTGTRNYIMLVIRQGETRFAWIFINKRIQYIDTTGSKEYTLDNFLTSTNALSKTNTTAYTPTADYNPATKKYVDDAISNAGGGGTTANDLYPTKMEALIETEEIEGTVEKTFYSGDLASANDNSITTAGTFWLTDVTSEMIGKKLKSVTINGVTNGGTITFRANTTISVSKSLTSTYQYQTKAETLNSSPDTIDIFQIRVNSGIQTYLLDGTDSRVTILNQDAINSCPLTLGITKESDTSVFKFNGSGLPNTGEISFFHKHIQGAISNNSMMGLAFRMVYEENGTSYGEEKKILKMTLSDESEINTDMSILFNDISASNKLKGKKISILGDSISTFNGFIPSGYATFYPSGNITTVEKTWWKQLIDNNEMTLVKNASWSGSCVTGNSTSTTDASAGCSTARINDLSNGTDTPEIIVVYIGINDFALTNHRELGNYDGSTAIPSEGTITTFSEAYGLMLYKILSKYHSSKVFCCTLLETAHTSYDTGENAVFPTKNNNGVLLSQYNDRIRSIATNLGARVIDLHSCGIHYWNLTYNTIDKLHPNSDGAVIIKDYIENALINEL